MIGLIPGEIVTTDCGHADKISVKNDILKVAVIERHHDTGHIGLGYIKGYGLKKGAVATSVAHDSHNIIAVGVSDEDIARAVNSVIAAGGGIFVTDGEKTEGLKMKIAGIMSEDDMETVNEQLENAKKFAYSLGVSKNIDPFMTLSFLSLPVIPKVKITTMGVFDVEKWQYKD